MSTTVCTILKVPYIIFVMRSQHETVHCKLQQILKLRVYYATIIT